MVAAWISAEMGVGPSIASGSQVCNGNCADLPTTPAIRSSTAAVRVVPDNEASVSGCNSTEMLVVRAPASSTTMPSTKPTSPTRVVRNALTAARRAASRSLSWPIRR